MVLLKFCQDLTYLKSDLRQSDSGTSQAMWGRIENKEKKPQQQQQQIAPEFTRRTAQNPLSTLQLNPKYRLPQKPEILNICCANSTQHGDIDLDRVPRSLFDLPVAFHSLSLLLQ